MALRKSATKPLTNKTCKQITQLVYDYLNDKLAAKVRKDFERHLDICPDCVAFMRTYKKTVGTAAGLDARRMPAKIRNNILSFLRGKLRQVVALFLTFLNSILV